jgi:hypothetical protein
VWFFGGIFCKRCQVLAIIRRSSAQTLLAVIKPATAPG